MNCAQWLKDSTTILMAQHIVTARLDSLVLLEDATNKNRSWLLAHPEFELDAKIATLLQKHIERRAQHEPLAYIRGKSEFYGREFIVTPDTLQPRPETETMIEFLKYILNHNITFAEDGPLQSKKDVVIVDVGTGSGCIAITAKLEFPDAKVYATEVNQAALKIAHTNAEKLNAKIEFFQGNLVRPILSTLNFSPYTIILANLPYVPTNYIVNEAATYEPRIALFGGEDGLDLYRKMFAQITEYREKSIEKVLSPKYIFTESLPFQHNELKRIAKSNNYKQIAKEDFIQVFQYL